MTIVMNVFKTLAKTIGWIYAVIILSLIGLIVLTNVMLHFVA